MSINRTVYLGLAVDVGDFDLAVGVNEDQDWLYRPFCERYSSRSKYWIPQQGKPKVAPSSCGKEFPLMEFGNENSDLLHVSDEFKKHLTPKCKAFLEDVCPDYKLVLVYLEYWS